MAVLGGNVYVTSIHWCWGFCWQQKLHVCDEVKGDGGTGIDISICLQVVTDPKPGST